MAKEILVEGCHNTFGFIQLDGFFLRYANNDFEQHNESEQSHLSYESPQEILEDQFPNAVSDLLLRITNRAWKSDNLFAADSIAAPPNTTYDRIYSIA